MKCCRLTCFCQVSVSTGAGLLTGKGMGTGRGILRCHSLLFEETLQQRASMREALITQALPPTTESQLVPKLLVASIKYVNYETIDHVLQ